MNYEQLLTAADQEGLLVKEQTLTGHDGLIRGRRIAIRKNIETQAEKSCVLAEEIGHYRTSSGNILDQSKAESRKQEYRARLTVGLSCVKKDATDTLANPSFSDLLSKRISISLFCVLLASITLPPHKSA